MTDPSTLYVNTVTGALRDLTESLMDLKEKLLENIVASLRQIILGFDHTDSDGHSLNSNFSSGLHLDEADLPGAFDSRVAGAGAGAPRALYDEAGHRSNSTTLSDPYHKINMVSILCA